MLLRPLLLLLFAATIIPLTSASISALEPSSPTQTFRAHSPCSFSWDIDHGGTWTSMDVDLMSGNNWEMVNVTRVASGVDGTDEGERSYTFECPEVDPPGPIYFYQFTMNGQDPVWTSRFTLAAANGTVLEAANATQPDGSPIPWGIGHLVNSSSANNLGTSSDPFAQNSTDKPFDEPLLPSTTTTTTTNTTGWWADWGAPVSTITSAAEGAQQTGITGFQEGGACDADSQCPEETPCCSEKGFCGSGRNCLAGCNPLGSFKPAACAPLPACQSGEYGLNYWDKNRVLTHSSHWNGDASTWDWLVDGIGKPDLGAVTADGTSGDLSLTLSLTNENNGTTITSTRSILYGNVTAKIKSVGGAGILTSFSLVSGTKDEVDFEFTTNATDLAQTAYFYRGDVDGYSSGQQVNITDRSSDYHDYTISWMPDGLTWLVDGIPVRSISKNDTTVFNGDSHKYPRTPSRIQFSIWAAGREGNPQGLVDFAGGSIDWNASTYAEKGFYASYVSGVKVECFDPTLLPDFSFSGNTTFSGAFNASFGSTVGISEDSSSSSAVSSIDPSAFGGEAMAATTTTTSQQAWWTPSLAAEQITEISTSSPAASWWKRSIRRRLFLEKVKRAETAFNSYNYGDLDENGQVSLSGGDAATIISSDSATGLNMLGIDPVAAQSALSVLSSALQTPTATIDPLATSAPSASSASLTTGTSTQSSASPSATAEEKTAKEKWDELRTAAHVGIYIGGAVAALFLVVLVGWIWRKAASSRDGAKGTPGPDAYGSYAPINDQGEMLPTGQIYSGSGEIQPGQQLYAGGQVPYGAPAPPSSGSAYAAAAAAPAPGISRKSSTLSRSGTLAGNNLSRTPTASSTKTYQGGYVPSSQLRKQFGVQQPQMKQV
ncbi:hypothetical protein JCM11251_000831 [Rhodosporidiobolus azoricus]